MVDESSKGRDRICFESSNEIRCLLDGLMGSGEYVTEAELVRRGLLTGLRLIKKARDGDCE